MSDGKTKVFDAEETREEQAQRLTANKTNDLRKANKSARDRYARHVRFLSDEQRRSLAAYLRRDFEQTLGVIDDATTEVPEFSFVPDFASDLQ